MHWGVLGPLEVRRGADLVALGGPKARTLVATLLLRANEAVSTSALIDELWGDDAPDCADNTLQVHVSRLRRVVGDRRIETVAPGYVLRVDSDELDVRRFDDLVDQAREAAARGDHRLRLDTLTTALGLWRGGAFEDIVFQFEPPGVAAMDERRLLAAEERFDALLVLGRDSDVIAELMELVRREPLRERLTEQLMVSLYRSGRQAEALRAANRLRVALRDLGLEPGASLVALEGDILNQRLVRLSCRSGRTSRRCGAGTAWQRRAIGPLRASSYRGDT